MSASRSPALYASTDARTTATFSLATLSRDTATPATQRLRALRGGSQLRGSGQARPDRESWTPLYEGGLVCQLGPGSWSAGQSWGWSGAHLSIASSVGGLMGAHSGGASQSWA